MQLLSRLYMGLLLVASATMLIWGLAGFFEYVTGIVPGIELQNAAYPPAVQFMHWLLITLTGAAFLLGYMLKWKWTPFVMIVLYSNLAVLCTIQSFDFMSEQWGYGQYFTEIVLYVVHASFLNYSSLSKAHFKHSE